MKQLLKFKKTAKGVALTLLQPAYDIVEDIPVPGAKAGIGALLDLIKGIDKTSRNASTIAELEKHILLLTELLEPLKEIEGRNLSSGLESDVRKLSTDLETAASNVKLKSSAGVVRRFLERHDDENDLRTFAQNLKNALDRFQVSQALRQAQELHFQREEFFLREQSALVRSLPRATNAAHDSGREDAPLPCLEGTRVAILAEITSWLERTESRSTPIYWLTGLAGIGKSTIAKTIAKQADDKNMLGGSFFFSRSDGPLRDPKLVFPTLAFQLAQSDNAFKSVIGDAIQLDATLGDKELLSQLDGLILTPLGKLGSDKRPTLVVLDALDECEEKGAATILRLLLSHVNRIPFLRILITSRPDPHISSVFDDARNHAKTILHDIEASVVQQDINLYIRTELAKIPKELGLRMDANWATDGEVNELAEKSGKLFVYAATSIRFIGDVRVRDPRRHLRFILSAQTSKESKATPYAQLDNLYLGVLQNSLSKFNSDVVVERFQTVVGSIVLLHQPLPLRSLARFVEYEMDEVDSALHHLHSVVIPPSSENEAPRIYHPSFLDFITNPARCSISDFVIVGVPDQERRHALRCFDLMAAFLKRDVAGVSDLSLLNREVNGFEQKVREALSPEVQYACKYWASHLSQVQFGDKITVQALGTFSMRLILMWFEAMSLIGSISTSARSIQEAHRWAMSSKCQYTTVKILSDAYRFILTHAEMIKVSALHVYHSAMAFTPRQTLIYETYSRAAMQSFKVLQGVESRWQRGLSTLVGHSTSVTSVAFSSDGLRLASGSDDCTIRLWDAVSGAHITTLEGHSGSVTSIAFSHDGLWLATGSHDYTLRLWDATSGTHITTLEGHSASVISIAFSPDGLRLASGSDDNSLHLWDVLSGALVGILQGHSRSVTSVTFSSDSSRLASGSHDQTIRLWDPLSGAHISTLGGNSGRIAAVTFSPDSLRLASDSHDHTLRLLDAMSGAHIATLDGHSDSVISVAFSPDGLYLASGSCDRTLRLWDAVSGAHIATLEGHSDWVISVVFSPDGLRLASGSRDNTLRLWDAVSDAHIARLAKEEEQEDDDWMGSTIFSPGSLRLAPALRDRISSMYDVRSGRYIADLEAHSGPVILVAISPNGLQLASGSEDRTLRLWHAVSGAHVATLKGHSKPVTSIVYSPDSLRLASGSHDNTVRLWDALSGTHIVSLEGHSLSVSSVAFSSDGLKLASGSYDQTVQLWDTKSGMHIATLEGHSSWIRTVAFSTDNCTLVSQTHVETFAWDVMSESPHRLDSDPLAAPPTSDFSALVLSRDGPWIQARHSQNNHVTRVCYIPTLYTPSTTIQAWIDPAVRPSHSLALSWIAFGCTDGRVIILHIHTHPSHRRHVTSNRG